MKSQGKVSSWSYLEVNKMLKVKDWMLVRHMPFLPHLLLNTTFPRHFFWLQFVLLEGDTEGV